LVVVLHAAEVLTTGELLDGRVRYEAVSGVYRNTRQDDLFWFAFRRPRCWVELDAETRSNGAMHVDVDGLGWGFLLVDGAVALECRAGGPGYRRLHSMVEYGRREPWPPPRETEAATWEGRQALRCRWDDEKMRGEALFDLASGLLIRTEWPGEVVELTDLRFDDAVDESAFVPPDRTLDGWRGGTAYVQHDRGIGLSSASWSPRSGPGRLLVPGPKSVPADEAIEWAGSRTDDIRVTEVRNPRPR